MKLDSRSKFNLLLSSCLVLSVGPAGAAGYGKAYEATVENYAGTMTKSHVWADGLGHQRTESVVNGVNNVSIMDIPNKVIYAIDHSRKTITTVPMDPKASNAPDPAVKWQAIGAKVIDGHPCVGKRATVDGMQMEYWEGTDTGSTVAIVANGKLTMKMTSWKPLGPNPGLFALPAGYQRVDMSALMRNMGSFDPSKFSAPGGGTSNGGYNPAAIQKMYQRNPASSGDDE